jgi:class 3 adenylate cyclase
MTATRRLAAILAADVAGYSRLIGADEGGTLQALKAIRAELIDPTIAAHNGRFVQDDGRRSARRVQQRGGCSALRDRGAGFHG